MLDVLIIGAGPAGLSLGCDMRRRGASVRVIDRLDQPVKASKGKGLQPRTLEVFDDLGIIGAVLERGHAYSPIAVYNGPQIVKHQVLTPIREASEAIPYPNTWMLPQWVTEELLTERLADLGGGVERGTVFESLVQHPDHVEVTLSTPAGLQVVEARYVVGADGGKSEVRRALGIPLVGDTPNLNGMLVGDVIADDIGRDHWHMWATSPGEMVLLCPLPDTELFQFIAMYPPDIEMAADLPAMQAVLDRLSKNAGPRLRDPSWISLFRPNIRMAAEFRKERVFLIGDAAHVHPPTGGQGLNTSVQDAYNLGWKLGAVLSGAADATLLDTYEEERLPIAAQVLGISEALYRKTTQGEDDGMRRGDDEQQLLLNYRGCTLSKHTLAATGLQPGDRMPNATLRSPTGEQTTLYDLMRGPEGLELFVGGSGAPAPDVRSIAVSLGSAADGTGYQNAGEVLNDLEGYRIDIRPDGYIRAIEVIGRAS